MSLQVFILIFKHFTNLIDLTDVLLLRQHIFCHKFLQCLLQCLFIKDTQQIARWVTDYKGTLNKDTDLASLATLDCCRFVRQFDYDRSK